MDVVNTIAVSMGIVFTPGPHDKTQKREDRNKMIDRQLDLGWSQRFFQEKVEEAQRVVRDVAARSTMPLVIQFSGGRDSMTLLGLVREVGVTNYVAAYMATGLELPGVVNFVRDFCEKEGIRLLVSHPGLHKGNLFHRIEQFQSFPNLGSFEGGGKRLWCCRDLKLRPQKKLLVKTFGNKQTFYRLEGIRRFESNRRKWIYRPYAETFMRPDEELKGSFETYPILNWSDADVLHYLEFKSLPTLRLYKDFGVSGCSWCPFYDSEIYYGVLKALPDWSVYRRVIEWEVKLNTPSIIGGIFLKEVRDAVLAGKSCPTVKDIRKRKSPCMMEFNGVMTPTCDVYGHLFLDGKCYRCDQPEMGKA